MNDPFDVIAPWDASRYFQAPVERTYTILAGQVVQVVVGDPQTVMLLFACTATSQVSVSILPFPSGGGGMMGVSGGLTITSGYPVTYFWGRHGPLVQQDWYAASAGGGGITVQTVKLAKWPNGGKRAKERR